MVVTVSAREPCHPGSTPTLYHPRIPISPIPSSVTGLCKTTKRTFCLTSTNSVLQHPPEQTGFIVTSYPIRETGGWRKFAVGWKILGSRKFEKYPNMIFANFCETKKKKKNLLIWFDIKVFEERVIPEIYTNHREERIFAISRNIFSFFQTLTHEDFLRVFNCIRSFFTFPSPISSPSKFHCKKKLHVFLYARSLH